jgi:hypothetical protein
MQNKQNNFKIIILKIIPAKSIKYAKICTLKF